MRKLLTLTLCFVLILSMFGCQPVNPADTPPETKPSEPTNSQPTDPTNQTTPQSFSVEDWQLEEPDYLSYEEYFASEREFSDRNTYRKPTEWIKGDQKFSFGYENAVQRELNKALVVECTQTGKTYIVPDSGAYAKHEIIGADGRYGYLYNSSQFVRIDLATGQAEVLLDGLNFCGCSDYSTDSVYLLDNLVVYFASYANDELMIGRLYLPTLKQETLYQTNGEFYDLVLSRPKTNQEPVVWTLKNPVFIDYLKTELADPNSEIQKGEHYDYSQLWKEQDALSKIMESPMHLHYLQDAGDQRALLKCAYNIDSREMTQQTGIMDECFHGSGYLHDHYNTDITTAPDPEVIMSQWTPINQTAPFELIPSADSKTDADIVVITGTDSNRYLYVKTDGDYQKIVTAPVHLVQDTGACVIYVATDRQTLMAVNYDGTHSVELYRAVNGEISNCKISNEAGCAVICDGDVLVEIDLVNGQYRQLVRHEHIKEYYFDNGIYFNVYVGMYVNGYTLDLQTGALKPGFAL